MAILSLFLVVLGLVLLFLATIGTPSSPRFNLLAGGLFCWLLSEVILRFPK
jgi:hypothetical protein